MYLTRQLLDKFVGGQYEYVLANEKKPFRGKPQRILLAGSDSGPKTVTIEPQWLARGNLPFGRTQMWCKFPTGKNLELTVSDERKCVNGSEDGLQLQIVLQEVVVTFYAPGSQGNISEANVLGLPGAPAAPPQT